MRIRASIVLLIAAGIARGASAQYSPELESPGAAEQLRLGVQAYHRGRFSESILLFEKSLAYAPSALIARYWLGRAYFKTGLEETALRAWQPLLERSDAPPALKAKSELIRASRALTPVPDSYRYVEVARFEGRKGSTIYFSRPSAVLPRRDGSLLVVAHGSNELVTFDAGGVIRSRDRGGLNGFDRPFGAAELGDGTLFVTEFNGDRIARITMDGSSAAFGKRGRGSGALVGPQYIAADGAGYIYVSDFGNARVSKFDRGGAFVLSFGAKQPESGFPGFASPSGIVEKAGTIYVADSLRKTIYRFDPSGNYLGPLAEGELHSPEGLSLWEGGKALLVADTDRLVSVDLETEALRQVYSPPDRRARIVGAAPDANGDIALCDFDLSAVSLISETARIAAGFDVEIERIVSDAFPVVEMDVSVRDRSGRPIVGLRNENFYATERLRKIEQSDQGGKAVVRSEESVVPAAAVELVGAGLRDSGARTTILVERAAATAADRESLRSTIIELYKVLGAVGSVQLVTAGPAPAIESTGDLASGLKAALAPTAGRGRIDLGLRLSASSLFPTGGRDSIVYVGSGEVDEASFASTTLSELAALLRNNGIRLFAVTFRQPSNALRYLVERSGGQYYGAARPRGLADLGLDIRSGTNGRYRLRFSSKAESDFGKAYLSVGIEAYLFKTSGRDELGFFAPLR